MDTYQIQNRERAALLLGLLNIPFVFLMLYAAEEVYYEAAIAFPGILLLLRGIVLLCFKVRDIAKSLILIGSSLIIAGLLEWLFWIFITPLIAIFLIIYGAITTLMNIRFFKMITDDSPLAKHVLGYQMVDNVVQGAFYLAIGTVTFFDELIAAVIVAVFLIVNTLSSFYGYFVIRRLSNKIMESEQSNTADAIEQAKV